MLFWTLLVLAAVAAVLVVIGAIVKTIMPLRWLLVASNACFVLYGALYPSYMVLLLHTTLLPINVWRALEMLRLTRRVMRAADSGDTSGVWLKSYMKRKRLAKGSVVFAKGDTADHLYMLVEGDMELVESGRRVEPGRVFGEIAFFALAGRHFGRLGDYRWLVLAALVTAVRFAATAAFGDVPAVLVAAQLTHVVTFAAQHMACTSVIARHFPDRLRTRGSALYTTLGYGVPGVVGGFAGGLLSQAFGLAAVFWAASLAALASAGCCVMAARAAARDTAAAQRGPHSGWQTAPADLP